MMDTIYDLRTGYEQMDVNAVHKYLSTDSYWAQNIPLETVAHSLEHSFCLGVFTQDQQVAFARLITDYSTFAYLADVYVLPEHRGKGLSKKMMQYITGLDWLQQLRRVMLATLDAQGLYRQFGFSQTPFPERIMERKKESPYGSAEA